MKELSVNEIEQVNSGILPLALGIVAADVSLMAAMFGAGYWEL